LSPYTAAANSEDVKQIPGKKLNDSLFDPWYIVLLSLLLRLVYVDCIVAATELQQSD